MFFARVTILYSLVLFPSVKPLRAGSGALLVSYMTLARLALFAKALNCALIATMDQTDLMAELSKAWQSVPYLSLALIVSAWTIGVFGLSILLDDCQDGESAADAITKLARRREFMKSHVV